MRYYNSFLQHLNTSSPPLDQYIMTLLWTWDMIMQRVILVYIKNRKIKGNSDMVLQYWFTLLFFLATVLMEIDSIHLYDCWRVSCWWVGSMTPRAAITLPSLATSVVQLRQWWPSPLVAPSGLTSPFLMYLTGTYTRLWLVLSVLISNSWLVEWGCKELYMSVHQLIYLSFQLQACLATRLGYIPENPIW